MQTRTIQRILRKGKSTVLRWPICQFIRGMCSFSLLNSFFLFTLLLPLGGCVYGRHTIRIWPRSTTRVIKRNHSLLMSNMAHTHKTETNNRSCTQTMFLSQLVSGRRERERFGTTLFYVTSTRSRCRRNYWGHNIVPVTVTFLCLSW